MSDTPRLILAPIRGITERTYRNLFHKHFGGFDASVAPFIASGPQKSTGDRQRAGARTRGDVQITGGDSCEGGGAGGSSYAKLLRKFDPADDTLEAIPQILSNDARDFVPLANALFARGHTQVNWNIGCPHPLVISKKKGSYLLSYPALIERFLEESLPALKGPISIKLRLGYAYPDEIFALLPVFNRFPLASLTVHARTGVQMYGGKCDIDTFEKTPGLSAHPVIYNGDITTVEEYGTLARRMPAIHGWMIGRGALADPFLPRAIREGSAVMRGEKVGIIHRFHDELFEEYSRQLASPSHTLDKMKGIWEYLSRSFTGSHKVFKLIRKAKSIAHYKDEAARIFDRESGSRSLG